MNDVRASQIAVMPAIDRMEAVARANGHVHEISSVAFTFAPANDAAPDPMVKKLRAAGLGHDDEGENGSRALDGPQSAPFRLWALAGSLLIDGIFRMHAPAGFSTLPRARERAH